MISESVYRALLVVYPKEHRREYGELMVQLFRDRMHRDGGGYRTLYVWIQMFPDLVGSAFNERLEGVRMWALLARDYTVRTARTDRQVVVPLLRTPILAVLLVFYAASILSILFPAFDGLDERAFRSGLFIFGGMAFLSPVFQGLVFRLGVKYDLKDAFRSIGIYLPLCAFAITASAHWVWAMLYGETSFLSISWLEILLASYFGALVCILPALTHQVGFVPSPAITTHRSYRRTDLARSLGCSFIGIAIFFALGFGLHLGG